MSDNKKRLTFSDVTFERVDLVASDISEFSVESLGLENLNFTDITAKEVDPSLVSPAVMVNGHYTPVDQTAYQGQFITQVGFNVVSDGRLTVYILDGVNTASCVNIYQVTFDLKKGQIWYDFNMYLPASMHLSFGYAKQDTAGVGKAAGAEQFYYNSGQLDAWNMTWGLLNMGVKIRNTSNIQHPLNGKTFCVIGDSISTYQAYNGKGNGTQYPALDVQSIKNTWWMQIAQKTGAKLVKNNSISATAVSGNKTDTKNPFWGVLQGRVQAFPNNVDVCFIAMGTNDLNSSRDFGTFNPNKKIFEIGTDAYDPNNIDTEKFNPCEFTDAMCNSIVQLQTNYPTTKFVWIIPLMMFDAGKQVFIRNNQTNASYRDRMIAVCNYYNIEYIDTINMGINYINYKKYLIDGIHPNAAGFKKMADYIINSYK